MPTPFIQICPALQNEYLALLSARLDMGDALPRPELRIYSTGGPEHGTLIAVCQMYLPSFTPPVNGRIVSNPITPCGSAIASGVAEHFRLVSKANVPLWGGSIGLAPDIDPRTGQRGPSPYGLCLSGTTQIMAGSVVSIETLTISLKQIMGG
jgi:hypothetical protein